MLFGVSSQGAFDDERESSEELAIFSREAGEASFSELFGVNEQSFLELFGAFPVIDSTLRLSTPDRRPPRYFS